MQSSQQAGQAESKPRPSVAQGQPPKGPSAKNRGRIDVMADVLNCCKSASSKSHIMLSANVNSIVATRMIEALAETGLLDSIHGDDNTVYLATEKGIGFVEKYVELLGLISPELVPAESKVNNLNRLNSLNF